MGGGGVQNMYLNLLHFLYILFKICNSVQDSCMCLIIHLDKMHETLRKAKL